PLEDNKLPENIDCLILGGGYPELYAKKLSENREMLESIRDAADSKMPIIAECGGFMYLHKSVKFLNGQEYIMAGVVDGIAFETSKLQRFGYAELTAERDNLLCKKGEALKSHEFHYWDSNCCGDCFTARKLNGKRWKCGYSTENIIAGFPHYYFYSKLSEAELFLTKCMEYRSGYGKNK
ncbi:MAG: cobyrinate a,c-diamide synthase, partial [Oscillospiraceae bacterium]|nr:cobyrinate a,c-diamide synthase [Oscillospiraceae bacterium]